MEEDFQAMQTTDESQQPEGSEGLGESQPQQDTETEQSGNDGRDWEAYARKLEAERREYKSSSDNRQAPQQQATAESQYTSQSDAIQALSETLKASILPEIEQRLSPLISDYQAKQEQKIFDEFSSDPRVKALGPEIRQELEQLPDFAKSMPLQARLQYARNQAIANNLDKIVSINQKLGTEKAYQNQQNKQVINSARQSHPARNDYSSVVERVLAGQKVSDAEYRANHNEIREAMRQAYIEAGNS